MFRVREMLRDGERGKNQGVSAEGEREPEKKRSLVRERGWGTSGERKTGWLRQDPREKE